jgi:hypothetical protein
MTTQEAIDRLQRKIDDVSITTARAADEAAAEIAGEAAPKEQEEILSALFEVAGKEFPGDWEDYAKAANDPKDIPECLKK